MARAAGRADVGLDGVRRLGRRLGDGDVDVAQGGREAVGVGGIRGVGQHAQAGGMDRRPLLDIGVRGTTRAFASDLAYATLAKPA